MRGNFRIYIEHCEQIQSKCACNSPDAAECAQMRDDLHPDDDFYMQRKCECPCHDEIADIKQELLP